MASGTEKGSSGPESRGLKPAGHVQAYLRSSPAAAWHRACAAWHPQADSTRWQAGSSRGVGRAGHEGQALLCCFLLICGDALGSRAMFKLCRTAGIFEWSKWLRDARVLGPQGLIESLASASCTILCAKGARSGSLRRFQLFKSSSTRDLLKQSGS